MRIPKYFQLPEGMTPRVPQSAALPSDALPRPPQPKPLLRLHINDLAAPGAQKFLAAVDVHEGLEHAVATVLSTLYPSPSTAWPGTRSVTLVIKSMPGVAYTTGTDLDNDHKEIHFSTEYIHSISSSRLRDEILGVLCHEMVHCWQHNGKGTAPGGLIEGVADYVRLVAGFVPPHWKREVGGDWDAGYQHTGYFLEYINETYGEGSVVAINETLKDNKYEKDKFWKGLFGASVDTIWEQYTKSIRDQPNEESSLVVGPNKFLPNR